MGSSANVCCDYLCRHPDYQRSPCSTPRLRTCCTSPPQAWTGRRWRPGSRGKAMSPEQSDDKNVHNAKMKVNNIMISIQQVVFTLQRRK